MEEAKMENLEKRLIAHRTKYWVELSDTEKIERMRDVLKNKIKEINRLVESVYNLGATVHSHLNNVVVAKAFRNSSIGGGLTDYPSNCYSEDAEKKGEVYF